MRFQKEEIAVFVIILCALLAAGALYIMSGVTVPYSWSSGNGSHVSVTGQVLSKEKTYQGGHIILHIKTNTGPLTVFVPSSSGAFESANRSRPGSEIEATGKVQVYKGEKEIVAETIKEKGSSAYLG